MLLTTNKGRLRSTAVHHHHAPVMVSLSAKANCLSVPRTTLRCEIVPSLSLDRTVWHGATADLLQYRERDRPEKAACPDGGRGEGERGRPRSKCQKGNNPCELEDRQPCRSVFFLLRETFSLAGRTHPCLIQGYLSLSAYRIQIFKKNFKL